MPTNNYINKIIHADNRTIYPLLDNESVDLVYCDPPYNVSKKGSKITIQGQKDVTLDYGKWDYGYDAIPHLLEWKRILNKDGSVIVWSGDALIGVYRDFFVREMYPKQLLVWVKQNAMCNFRQIGYRNFTEYMVWGMKNKPYKKNPNFLFKKQTEMRNYFTTPMVSGAERIQDTDGVSHPTQKPVAIGIEIVRKHCRVGGLVLDPFAGVGTSAIACIRTGRNFINIEQDDKWFKMGQKRIDEEIGQGRIFDEKIFVNNQQSLVPVVEEGKLKEEV
jgi:DNA modification methylase